MASSPRLRIPPEHRQALREFAGLSPAAADALLDALVGLPSGTGVSDVAAKLGDATDLDPAQAASLTRALLSAAAQGTYHGWSVETVVQSISHNEDLELDADQAEVLGGRLQRAVDSSAIWLTASASDLQTDHERVFRSARVISDIRPIFARGPVAAPEAAVISEMLKLEYYRDGEVEQVYVALDRSDLDRLKQVIDRAITKSDFLSRMLESAGVNHMELEEVLDEDD